jgi:uncharacterized protein YecE (DUF72 family)
MIRVGTSGWSYPPWRKVFYPAGVAQRRELEHLSSVFDTVEINSSFYALQRPSNYDRWFEQTPDDFVFAVKAPRLITHEKRLLHIDEPLADFFGSGVLALGHKLGPVLWQLPPSLGFNARSLAAFAERLPRTTGAAADLARGHSERGGERVWDAGTDRPLRHAIEVRHRSFASPAAAEILQHSDIALVVAETAGKFPFFEELTADFVYVRLHGDVELYKSGYTSEALDRWAGKIRGWAAERDVYAYFDNTMEVRAPFDALALRERLD